ncbi:MAG: DUF2252 family protein, partial [Candidatus Sericytochromatia bacterium]|nr:DUF2252 family protein [Candidatus Sericytochromatia bacterium]
LARCATSIQLAAENAGIGENDRDELVDYFLNGYNNNLNRLQTNLSELNQPISDKYLTKPISKAINKVSNYSSNQFMQDMIKNGSFILNDKITSISTDIKTSVTLAVNNYLSLKKNTSLRVKDVAARIAGKGSLGKYRYIVLLGDPKQKISDFILELKEASQPSSTIAIGSLSGNQAQRVVQANKYFVSLSDPYLDTIKINNIDFFIKQLNPDEKVDLSKMDKKSDFKEFLDTVAYVVARANARSGKYFDILKDFKQSQANISQFSKQYSKQVKQDFEAFKNNH